MRDNEEYLVAPLSIVTVYSNPPYRHSLLDFSVTTLAKEAMDFHFQGNISDKQSRMKIQLFQHCFGDLYFISLLMVGFFGSPFHTKDERLVVKNPG